MSDENAGGQGSQPIGGQAAHWLHDARDALSRRAGQQGQEWLGQAQDHAQGGIHDAGQWAGQAQNGVHNAYNHDVPSGDWVNGEWVAHAQTAADSYTQEAHDAALGAIGQARDNQARDNQVRDHQAREGAAGVAALDLNDRDRLPWLESAEDDDDYYAVDTRRVIAAVVGGILLLAVVVGGVWAFTHRKDAGTPVADGSVIGASEQPYKQAPNNPGGRQFEGTGDSSFAAAQGKDHPAQLAAGDARDGDAGAKADAAKADAAKTPDAKADAAKPAAAANDAGPVGGVVQIAAYSNETAARSGWDRLVQQHESLKGANHRIVQGQADIGTVYRLQLVTNAGGGSALCEKLKAEGVSCQVKH